jgi:hypothetical protein
MGIMLIDSAAATCNFSVGTHGITAPRMTLLLVTYMATGARTTSDQTSYNDINILVEPKMYVAASRLKCSRKSAEYGTAAPKHQQLCKPEPATVVQVHGGCQTCLEVAACAISHHELRLAGHAA